MSDDTTVNSIETIVKKTVDGLINNSQKSLEKVDFAVRRNAEIKSQIIELQEEMYKNNRIISRNHKYVLYAGQKRLFEGLVGCLGLQSEVDMCRTNSEIVLLVDSILSALDVDSLKKNLIIPAVHSIKIKSPLKEIPKF